MESSSHETKTKHQLPFTWYSLLFLQRSKHSIGCLLVAVIPRKKDSWKITWSMGTLLTCWSKWTTDSVIFIDIRPISIQSRDSECLNSNLLVLIFASERFNLDQVAYCMWISLLLYSWLVYMWFWMSSAQPEVAGYHSLAAITGYAGLRLQRSVLCPIHLVCSASLINVIWLSYYTLFRELDVAFLIDILWIL